MCRSRIRRAVGIAEIDVVLCCCHLRFNLYQTTTAGTDCRSTVERHREDPTARSNSACTVWTSHKPLDAWSKSCWSNNSRFLRLRAGSRDTDPYPFLMRKKLRRAQSSYPMTVQPKRTTMGLLSKICVRISNLKTTCYAVHVKIDIRM